MSRCVDASEPRLLQSEWRVLLCAEALVLWIVFICGQGLHTLYFPNDSKLWGLKCCESVQQCCTNL